MYARCYANLFPYFVLVFIVAHTIVTTLITERYKIWISNHFLESIMFGGFLLIWTNILMSRFIYDEWSVDVSVSASFYAHHATSDDSLSPGNLFLTFSDPSCKFLQTHVMTTVYLHTYVWGPHACIYAYTALLYIRLHLPTLFAK